MKIKIRNHIETDLNYIVFVASYSDAKYKKHIGFNVVSLIIIDKISRYVVYYRTLTGKSWSKTYPDYESAWRFAWRKLMGMSK